mgnify:CR=1 FL=1
MDTLHTVQHYMTQNVITVHKDLNIYKAIDKLLHYHISGTPVIDDSGNMVGILTEKDCLRIMANGSFHEMPGGPASRYMSKDVKTVSLETDIFVVADLFLKNTLHLKRREALGKISKIAFKNGISFYNSGDTDYTDLLGFAGEFKPDIASICINGGFNNLDNMDDYHPR